VREVIQVLNTYPVSKRHFLGWMIETYAVDERSFRNGPFEAQCQAIWMFLGHPTPDISNWSADEILFTTEDYLYLYEDVCIRYPYGAIDVIKEIRKLDYSEIPLVYPEAHTKKDLAKDLRHAIVSREVSYEMNINFIKSLRDAVVSMIPGVSNDADEEIKWNEYIQQSWSNETAPF